jgi:iron complex outermembrane recepter protein
MPRKLIFIALLSGSAPAYAQQASNNAVTQSEDAFGRAVGNERIGIYSNEEVRGFNPLEAGNNRLEGLYIDQGQITSPRLIDGSSIRVGYAARGTPFPAPTGIIDLRMEKFAGKTEFNAEMEWEDNSNVGAALEAKLPLAGEKLGVSFGAGFREVDQVHGRNGSFRNAAASLSWLPTKGSEIILFTSGARAKSAEFSPFIYPLAGVTPPRQPRKLQQTQPWAEGEFAVSASGLIAKFPVGDFRIEAGLFRTTRRDPKTFVTLQLATDATGRVGDLVVIADQDNGWTSHSGEIRLSRSLTVGKVRHTLIAMLRGREQDRDYGGAQRISLGASRTGIQDFRPEPAFNFGANDTSRVRQMTYGLQYNLQTIGGVLLSLSAQKADYRKSTDFANIAISDTVTRDSPLLISASGSIPINTRLTTYGGFVRGLEESAIAPDIAVNRNEAPPAIRTRQMDFGLRYAISPKLALIAGVFEVKKPYFGVDVAGRFTNLGTVANRGIELSLAGTLAPGLTVVAGGILVNPKISGAEVDAGRIGPRPIGSFRKRAIFNLDWKPVKQDAWSFDMALEGVSPETADRLNIVATNGRHSVNLGARYRFDMAGSKMLIRGQMLNTFNHYGWRVNSSGGYAFSLPRTVYLQLTADF